MAFTPIEVACCSFVACLSFVCQIACHSISSILSKTFVSIHLEMPFVCRFVCRFPVGWPIAYVLEEFFPFLAYELEKVVSLQTKRSKIGVCGMQKRDVILCVSDSNCFPYFFHETHNKMIISIHWIPSRGTQRR